MEQLLQSCFQMTSRHLETEVELKIISHTAWSFEDLKRQQYIPYRLHSQSSDYGLSRTLHVKFHDNWSMRSTGKSGKGIEFLIKTDPAPLGQ